jgi:hypothetical protein
VLVPKPVYQVETEANELPVDKETLTEVYENPTMSALPSPSTSAKERGDVTCEAQPPLLTVKPTEYHTEEVANALPVDNDT